MTDLLTPRLAPVRATRPRRGSLAARAVASESPLRRLDWVLLLATLGMVAIGAVMVWSATRQKEIDAGGDPQAFLKRHLLNAAIGLCLAAVTALVDYRVLRGYAPVVYVAAVLGLVAVLSPLGSTVNGAHSWIVLPAGFQVQPSEYAKVALVVIGAFLLAERREQRDTPTDRDVLLLLAVAAVPMGLIQLQPDFGTDMVFVFTILGLLAISGAPTRWVAGLTVAGVAAGWYVITSNVLEPYQRDRLTAFANPNGNTSLTGYQVDQAKNAIGSGGLFGRGLFHGTQTKGGFIPFQQTDFIFTAVGEELGLLGVSVLLLLLAVVLWRALRIAQRANDPFGAIIAGGVVSWFTFQSFVNIGMTLGIMPVTGLPLPFVSYGGSAMFANLMAVGLLENVRMRTLSREP